MCFQNEDEARDQNIEATKKYRECRRCYSKQGEDRVQVLMEKEREKIQRHALP